MAKFGTSLAEKFAQIKVSPVVAVPPTQDTEHSDHLSIAVGLSTQDEELEVEGTEEAEPVSPSKAKILELIDDYLDNED